MIMFVFKDVITIILHFYTVFFAGNNSVAKYLSSVDTRYNSLFQDSFWKEVWEKSEKEAAGKAILTIFLSQN